MLFTNEPRDDGFGGQFQSFLWDLLFVKEALHEDYIIVIPEKMEHNYENDPKFIQKLMKYTNLEDLVPFTVAPVPGSEMLNRGKIYEVIQSNIDFFHSSPTMKKYQDVFYKDKQSPFDLDYFNIAVHVRRFNKGDHYDQGLSMEKHVQQLNKLRVIYKEKKYRIHIYSQGDDIKEILKGDDIVYHLDESNIETFTGFIFADVLCIAPSSFSYTAGLITRNQVYYFNFWHKTLEGWIDMEA